MSILSGFKKVIRYIKTSAGYSKLSQWTSSQTVEMDDGSNLENKITDINTYINNKANISSPTFTGIPKAPTASNGTNNTQIATTAFANNAVSNHNSSSVAHSDIRSLITGLENAIPEASTTPSKAPGTASAGVSQEYSRGDHVHPAQTSVSGNAGTATKLSNARNINGVLFDGTEDINIQEYYNFSFPSNYGEERYRGFCSLYNTATVQANPSELTLLVSGVGSYGTGDKKSGVYLIQCRTMQGLVMDVIELSPPGSAGGIEFGYWSDGDKIIFGVHHGIWNYKINVLKIQQTYGHTWEINVANLYDSTAKPNGWNTVSKKGMVMSESGVSAIKQITQEQYNALSSAEKMNNTIYFITDAD